MRRFLIALTVLALAVSSTPLGAQNKLVNIKVTQAVAAFSFLTIDYARAAGYYEKEGLEVEQVATNGGGPDIAALVSGNVQFDAASGIYQMGAIRAHRDVQIVYNYFNRNSLEVMMSKETLKKLNLNQKSPFLTKAKALKGLKLGITRPGALTDRMWRRLLRVAGLTENDVTITAVGGEAAEVSALERNLVDGVILSPPWDLIAAQHGGELFFDYAGGEDPQTQPLSFQSLLTTKAYAEANPDIVKKMVRATRHANEDIANKSAEDIAAVVQPIYKDIDRKLLVAGVRELKKTVNVKGEVTMDMARRTMLLDGSDDITPEQFFATFNPAYLQ
jgi:NitT/TauT family transport system substrate-binding protein